MNGSIQFSRLGVVGACALLAGLAMPAHAADSGWYAGATAGVAMNDDFVSANDDAVQSARVGFVFRF